jgi:hypothetical protein
VTENRVQIAVFGLKKEEVTEDWWKMHIRSFKIYTLQQI